MARNVLDAAQARGSLVVDAKDFQQAWGQAPPKGEPVRALAWDEDATTLAIEAAASLDLSRVDRIALGPNVDPATFLAALDLRAPVHVTTDPLALATTLQGRVLAAGSDIPANPLAPGAATRAVACLVDDTEAAPPSAPREVAKPLLAVSASRALQESRALVALEPMPDTPMGAYVPMQTWVEDLPARLRLEAQRCSSCGRTLYPPRGACPECLGRSFTPVALPREAVVLTATRIGRGGAPSEFALEQAQVGAYWVAVVEWPEQEVRCTVRLAAYDERGPAIGDLVRGVVRRLFEQEGTVRYGVKFVPA